MGLSVCNDYMQTTKQYYSKCKRKNRRNQAIIEDKYATLGASFIDISLTSQWAIAGICFIAVEEFRQKILQNIYTKYRLPAMSTDEYHPRDIPAAIFFSSLHRL